MSGQSFPQDVVAGTQLVVPSIHSPNFITQVSGWTINLDGSAEFNNLTIRGTFSGNNFILNSSGMFFYSPSEAAGNLIFSITPTTGTDSFGNAYLTGTTSYTNNGPFYSAASLDGGIMTWYKSTTEAGPWTNEAGIGFTFVNGIGGGLLLEDTGAGTQVSGNLTVNGTLQLSVSGITDVGTLINAIVSALSGANTSTNGLTDGTIAGSSANAGLTNGQINGTSGAASTGTAHTHSAGSYAVTNGQHSHSGGSYAVTDGTHHHTLPVV